MAELPAEETRPYCFCCEEYGCRRTQNDMKEMAILKTALDAMTKERDRLRAIVNPPPPEDAIRSWTR